VRLYEFTPGASSQSNTPTRARHSEDLVTGLHKLRKEAIRRIVESYMHRPQPLKPEQVRQMSEEIAAATEPFARLICLATDPRRAVTAPSPKEQKEGG
jgi:hypothetical protein